MNVPLIKTIIRIPSDQLLPALDVAFLLIDAFTISLFTAKIWSVICHFQPAHDFSIIEFSQSDMDEPSTYVYIEDNVT